MDVATIEEALYLKQAAEKNGFDTITLTINNMLKTLFFLFIAGLAAIATFITIQKKAEDGCIP